MCTWAGNKGSKLWSVVGGYWGEWLSVGLGGLLVHMNSVTELWRGKSMADSNQRAQKVLHDGRLEVSRFLRWGWGQNEGLVLKTSVSQRPYQANLTSAAQWQPGTVVDGPQADRNSQDKEETRRRTEKRRIRLSFKNAAITHVHKHLSKCHYCHREPFISSLSCDGCVESVHDDVAD